MTFSTFSGLELSEAEGPAFDSKKELVFLCNWLNNIHVIPFEFSSGIIPLYSGTFG
jgi:hypothetical protein